MISKSSLDKINDISDEQLKKTLEQVALSSGIDATAITPFLSDIGAIRKAVSSVSQRDIDNLMSSVSEENAGRIADILKNNLQGE